MRYIYIHDACMLYQREINAHQIFGSSYKQSYFPLQNWPDLPSISTCSLNPGKKKKKKPATYLSTLRNIRSSLSRSRSLVRSAPLCDSN